LTLEGPTRTMRGVPGLIPVTFRLAIGHLARGRLARPVPVVAVIGCALRPELPAGGCGPADLVAAPRPEGYRPGGRGRPPIPE